VDGWCKPTGRRARCGIPDEVLTIGLKVHTVGIG
jgi:hypothetical protein